MKQRLAGKGAAVTAAASGIGLECARHMAAAGAELLPFVGSVRLQIQRTSACLFQAGVLIW